MGIEILQEGTGELIGWHDPDNERLWIQQNKPRDLRGKRMTVNEGL